MYKLCQHMMPTGNRCQSPALKNTRFCYYHGRRVRKSAPTLPLVFLEDHDSIQHNLHLILLALQEGRISPAVAESMLRICRAASANLNAALRSKRKPSTSESHVAKSIEAHRI